MNTFKIASVLLTTAIMTGCASTSSEPTGSYARQVATAGGLRLEDHKVPRAQYDAALSSVTDAGLNTSVLASSHGFNMGGGAALGVGLAAWLFSPAAPEQKNAIIAFVPSNQSSSETVKKEFALLLAKAYQQAYRDMNGYTPSEIIHNNFLGESYIVAAQGKGCDPDMDEPNRGCQFSANVVKPTQIRSPAFLNVKGDVYRFGAREKALSDSGLYDDAFDKRTFLLNVSKHLPDWAYVYAAPVRKVSPPMIFHKGEVHYFVVPDA
ncbi:MULTISPECIES: hypothetical protein [Pseudomonas]|uniref:hypothetical protein n=1 Tax=Pseudomonas TaxID=286 RepID=UPI0015E46854|nr:MULTISPECIES: hypothetical protein [Pseudomonas]MBA1250335.1 hypothetical protein [Pseudomonas zeshuii]